MTLDLDVTLGWTDYKILDYRLNQSSGISPPGKAIEDMTLEEISQRFRIINNPHVLTTIWKPNIIFGELFKYHNLTLKSKIYDQAFKNKCEKLKLFFL